MYIRYIYYIYKIYYIYTYIYAYIYIILSYTYFIHRHRHISSMYNRISLVMAMLSRTSASTKPLDLESLIFGCALSATLEASPRDARGIPGGHKIHPPKKCPENLGRSELMVERRTKKTFSENVDVSLDRG